MAIEWAGADLTDSSGLAITSGTAGVKGSYVEIIASTARESYLLTIMINATSVDHEGFLYLATGAASSEVDFLEIPFHGNADEGYSVTVPITIAASARLSGAVISTDASSVAEVSVALSDDNSYGTCAEAETIGHAGGGQGTDVNAGSSANTKPTTWTELVASTAHDYDALLIHVGYSNNSAQNNYHFLIDIATGVTTSEVAIVENVNFVTNAFELYGLYHWIYVPVTSGTRISARCQCDTTDATDRIVDVSVVGFNLTAPAGGGGISRLAGPSGGLISAI